MPEFNVEVAFEVWCGECGAGLCNNTNVRVNKNGRYHIDVKPCDDCLKHENIEGHNEGHDVGYDVGYDEAYHKYASLS